MEDITNNYWRVRTYPYLGPTLLGCLDLKQYVTAKLTLGIKNIIVVGLNLVIMTVAIDPHMVVIQVQVGKNIVENVLLDGGFGMNIMTEEL